MGLFLDCARLRKSFPDYFVHRLVALGVLIYAGTGVVNMLLGGNFLDYNVLAEEGYKGQHWGIIAVELGVGVTVFGVMMAIYYSFAGRPPRLDDKDW